MLGLEQDVQQKVGMGEYDEFTRKETPLLRPSDTIITFNWDLLLITAWNAKTFCRALRGLRLSHIAILLRTYRQSANGSH